MTDSSPAGDHKLPLAGLASNPGVDVHGEEGAGAVEDGGERAHEGGQHDGEHEASQTCPGIQVSVISQGRKMRKSILFYSILPHRWALGPPPVWDTQC